MPRAGEGEPHGQIVDCTSVQMCGCFKAFFLGRCSKPQASRICPLLTGPLGLLRECVRLQRFPLFPGWEDRFEMTSQGHLTRDLALASSSESPFLHNACRMITTNILWVIISKRYCTFSGFASFKLLLSVKYGFCYDVFIRTHHCILHGFSTAQAHPYPPSLAPSSCLNSSLLLPCLYT